MMQNNVVESKDIKNYILSWNNRFPIDYWWRKKYNIPFNSQSHREFCFIDMMLDYIEEYMFSQKSNEKQIETYVPGQSDWLKIRELSQDEVDKAFDAIEI